MTDAIMTLLEGLASSIEGAGRQEAVVQLSRIDALGLWLARTRHQLDESEAEPFAGMYIREFEASDWQAIDARTEEAWLHWRAARERQLQRS